MSKAVGDRLPDDAFSLLTARIPTVIVATVSSNGFPNTTPIYLTLAKDRKTLLLAMARRHQGTANIRETGKAMACMCEEGDVNVSIRGNASIIKEHMNCNKAMCVVRIDIIDVKDDSTHSETTSGIRFRFKSERGKEFVNDVFAELVRMEIK